MTMLGVWSPFILFLLTTQCDLVSALRSNRVTDQIIRSHRNTVAPLKRDNTIPDALTVELPINHFGPSNGTFLNRYWINDTYYQSGGPVFIYDSGEGDAEPLVPIVLQEEGYETPLMQLAKKYNGIGLLWEHRYYGKSLPFPVNNSTTGDEWQYLTFDQALEDFVYFANNFTLPANSTASSKLSSPDAVKPSKTPWIFIGASYPGVRSAVLRVRNPEVIFASWASSAPVQAQVNMASYYEAAERSLPRNCSTDWVAITKYVDDTLNGSNTTLITQVKSSLYIAHNTGPGNDTTNVVNVSPQVIANFDSETAAEVLMDPLDFFQSSGLRSIMPFCDRLETLNFTQTPADQGVIVTHGLDVAFQAFMLAISEVDYNGLLSQPADSDPGASYSWSWQFCSEFGYFQSADPNNPVSIETTFNSLAVQQQRCNQIFDSTSFLPKSPNVTAVDKYGGWQMNPSNVYFSNGEFDPWRTLSVGSQESNSPQRNASSTVPACGGTGKYPAYFGLTYAGQVHGSDMFSSGNNSKDNKPFLDGLTLFEQALDSWLPCFGLANQTDTTTPANTNNGGALGLRSSTLSIFMLISAVAMLY